MQNDCVSNRSLFYLSMRHVTTCRFAVFNIILCRCSRVALHVLFNGQIEEKRLFDEIMEFVIAKNTVNLLNSSSSNMFGDWDDRGSTDALGGSEALCNFIVLLEWMIRRTFSLSAQAFFAPLLFLGLVYAFFYCRSFLLRRWFCRWNHGDSPKRRIR